MTLAEDNQAQAVPIPSDQPRCGGGGLVGSEERVCEITMRRKTCFEQHHIGSSMNYVTG